MVKSSALNREWDSIWDEVSLSLTSVCVHTFVSWLGVPLHIQMCVRDRQKEVRESVSPTEQSSSQDPEPDLSESSLPSFPLEFGGDI